MLVGFSEGLIIGRPRTDQYLSDINKCEKVFLEISSNKSPAFEERNPKSPLFIHLHFYRRYVIHCYLNLW